MEKLNELVYRAKGYLLTKAEFQPEQINVSCKTILAIAEAFRALEQRAEAAEAECSRLDRESQNLSSQLGQCNRERVAALAKLAEKGAPVAMRFRYHPSPCCAGSWVYADIDKFKADTSGRYQEQELFTSPAADLDELVPERKSVPESGSTFDSVTHWCDGFNSCRAEILRNIEEAKQK